MSELNHSILAITVLAPEDVTGQLFCAADGSVCGDGEAAIGVFQTDQVAGKRVTVDLLGTISVRAGAAIPAGSRVQSNANGQAIVAAAGAVNGILVPGSSADAAGDLVEIIPTPN